METSPGGGLLARRRSGIDFDDVFGGPPARSAFRRSGEDSSESPSLSGRDPDGRGTRAASLGEKPVFGDAYSPSPRRKGLSDDFFSDIFKGGGGGSGSSTPRRLDWDTSSPGSRVLSPVKVAAPMPRAEPADGSFVLSPLSVAQKVKKEQSPPAFGTSPDLAQIKLEEYSLNADAAPHTEKEVPSAQTDWRTDYSQQLHRSNSALGVSRGRDAPFETDNAASIGRTDYHEDSAHPKDKKRGNQFHFSIYKWASKGVMLVVPSSPKGGTKTRISGLPEPFLHGVDLPLNKKTLSSNDRVFPSEFERQNSERFTDAVNVTSHQKLGSLPFSSDRTAKSGVSVEPGVVSGSQTKINVLQTDGNGISGLKQEKEMPTLQKLFDLLKDHSVGKDGEQVDSMEGSSQQTASKRNTRVLGETRQQSVKRTNMRADADDAQCEQKVPASEVKGNVKKFVKVFSKDGSHKPMVPEPQGWPIKANDTERNTLIDYERLYSSKLDGDKSLNYGNKDEIQPNEYLGKLEKLDNDTLAEIQRILESSTQKNQAIVLEPDSTLENVEVLSGDVEEAYFEVEECTVEQVVFHLHDHDDLPQTHTQMDELQNSDAKIREWSFGKEGNIRSLLSTLQYVLWPGSGWKVVPLVDLIESSSVRKAYQKALLCLHPDKLQQRGAPDHQKYLAAKVFDILQEAWDQFNSVGPI